MKAVITNRIYLQSDNTEELQAIVNKLIYKIPAMRKGDFPQYLRTGRVINPKMVSIPQGRLDLVPSGYEIVDKRNIIFADFPEPLSPLREDQQVIHDKVNSSCIVNAPVSWGKTYVALHIARTLGQKTIVVVHNSALRDQWVEEVEKLFGFKPDIIGNGKYGIDTPIVISNVQSLINNILELKNSFGTMILDEAHRVPASTFTKIVDIFNCRYKLGLTGTMERKDGKHVVLQDYFGSTIFKPLSNNFMEPTIEVYKTPFKLPPATTWSLKVTELLGSKEYQRFIAAIAAIKIKQGHQVLIVADRVIFLEEVAALLGDRAACVTGTTKDRDIIHKKLLAKELDALVGSISIYKEGISVNSLSCLILATPTNNVPLLRQLIGRVIRKADNKLDPLVVDIQLVGHSANQQSSTRLAHYFESNYKMKLI